SRLELRGITVLGTIELSGDGELALAFATLIPRERPSIRCAPGSTAAISLRRTISGAIEAGPEARLAARESIIDGCGDTAIGDRERMLGELDLRSVTVLGSADALVTVAEQSILAGVLRTSEDHGLLVHSFVARGSTLGPRVDCVPDGVEPRFSSTSWGDPSYCQLALDCPVEIAGGDGA